MAGWKAHVIGGAVFSLVVLVSWVYYQSINIEWYTLAIIIPIIFLYSQLPDVDHENSKITHMFVYYGVTLNAGVVFLVYFSKISFVTIIYSSLLLLVIVNAINLPHRGITHTLTACVVFSLALLFVFNWFVALIAFIAYWSHLFLDCSKGKPFYPLRLWGAWK